MVALEPALRDERVGAGREGVRDHIFEFAGLAAAEREARVEVVARRKTLVVPDGLSLRERFCRGWIGVGPGRVSWVRGREARAAGRDGIAEVIKVLDIQKDIMGRESIMRCVSNAYDQSEKREGSPPLLNVRSQICVSTT